MIKPRRRIIERLSHGDRSPLQAGLVDLNPRQVCLPMLAGQAIDLKMELRKILCHGNAGLKAVESYYSLDDASDSRG
jgi:hypothetical protein